MVLKARTDCCQPTWLFTFTAGKYPPVEKVMLLSIFLWLAFPHGDTPLWTNLFSYSYCAEARSTVKDALMGDTGRRQRADF